MKWTTERVNKLTEMFNNDCKDAEIAAAIGVGVMALAKQRSLRGLVYYKRNNKLKIAKRQPANQEKQYYALSYVKNGIRHYSNLGDMTLQRAVAVAIKLIHTNHITDVNVLKSCGVIKNGSLKYKEI